VIAHRLSTVRRMDRLVVLENGAILEQGPHDALLAAGGTYAKLWAHQSGGFLQDLEPSQMGRLGHERELGADEIERNRLGVERAG